MPCNLDPIVVEQLYNNLCKLKLNLSIDYIKQLALNYDYIIGTIYWHKVYVKVEILLALNYDYIIGTIYWHKVYVKVEILC
jgi:hypothetical protein